MLTPVLQLSLSMDKVQGWKLTMTWVKKQDTKRTLSGRDQDGLSNGTIHSSQTGRAWLLFSLTNRNIVTQELFVFVSFKYVTADSL